MALNTTQLNSSHLNDTDLPCRFPFTPGVESPDCVSAAQLLGVSFQAAVIVYAVLSSILLFGLLRAGLRNYFSVTALATADTNVWVPLTCAVASALSLAECSNLFLLNWETTVWSTLAAHLFVPCMWTVCLLYYRQLRAYIESVFEEVKLLRILPTQMASRVSTVPKV